MKILIACECSGAMRRAFTEKGHDVWSVDLDPAEDNSPRHHVGDALIMAHTGTWDLMIAHPPCTYLANSGVRWLWKDIPSYASYASTFHDDVERVKVESRWNDMEAGARFFANLLRAPIAKIAVENPVMHGHAREAIGVDLPTHFVQPWWFGDKAFKATGFTLKGLEPLKRDSRCLVPPKKGTDEHKAWSVIHNMSPGPNRAKDRSRTFPGIARAAAEQWG